MNHQNKKVVAHLVTMENAADRSLVDLIELNLGGDTKIRFIRSPKVFIDLDGLADKIKQFEGTGLVIAKKSDFKEDQLEAAARTGIKFAVVYYEDGSGEWRGFYADRNHKKIPFAKRAKAIAVAA